MDDERESDLSIARKLLAANYITGQMFDCYLRAKHGQSIYSMRRLYPNESRGGGFFYATTLHAWVAKVQQAIDDAREIDKPAEPEHNPFGISIADSHKVRLAADPTPQGRLPLQQSTWDAERLRAGGVIDRYSRKRL